MIEEAVVQLRQYLLDAGNRVSQLKASLLDKETPIAVGEKEDRGEVIANVILAYRHIEDARMRLGKVFQALDGGVSNSEK